jgi:predicted membrane chloride channel (bestrophin family)
MTTHIGPAIWLAASIAVVVAMYLGARANAALLRQTSAALHRERLLIEQNRELLRRAQALMAQSLEAHRALDARASEFSALLAAHMQVLQRAESFIAGFEDDIEQEGVTALLTDLRGLIGLPQRRH